VCGVKFKIWNTVVVVYFGVIRGQKSKMERFRSCFDEVISSSNLAAIIPSNILEPLIPSIVFFGSQEHGTTLLMEHFLQFPLPQKLRIPIEVYLRSVEKYPEEMNRIEMFDENNNLLPDLTVIVPEPTEWSTIDEDFYENLYLKVKTLLEEREGNNPRSSDLTLRLCFYSANLPLLNVLFFPLECKKKMSDHLTTQATHSYYCFVLSVFTPFRQAEVNEIYFNRKTEVCLSSPLPSPPRDLILLLKLKGISSEILTRFGFRDNQEMRWKEIIDTSITRNSNNRIRATQLPIVCSTVGQINERLWNVSVNQFYEQEKEFFHHLSEQVKQCGSLITHHQATCFCLFDHHLSQFYSQYIRRKWIPLYIYELLLKWSQERGTTGEEKKRSEHEMILTELFDQIHIESSGMELLNRIQFIAIELASDDHNNPLLTFSLPSTIALAAPASQ
jgi:hypothetical protein